MPLKLMFAGSRAHSAENRALRMYVTTDRRRGKLAITRVKVLLRAPSATLLEIILESGRKHQIRVHLAEAGHPLLGDRRYGEDRASPIGRLALHAVALASSTARSTSAAVRKSRRRWRSGSLRPSSEIST